MGFTLEKQPLHPKNPQQLPVLLLIPLSCSSHLPQVSMILTLMVPYDAIDTESPLMEMFVVHGFYAAKFIVAIGSVAGLTVSLLGSLFPMPRVIYAMAGDGLLFRSVTPMLAFIFHLLGSEGKLGVEGPRHPGSVVTAGSNGHAQTWWVQNGVQAKAISWGENTRTSLLYSFSFGSAT